MWQVLRSFNIEEGLVQAIQALYENSSCAVLLKSQLGEFFKTTVSVRHGCILSSILFNLFLRRSCRKRSMTITHPSPFVEGPHATYDLPTSISWAIATANFKTSPKDSQARATAHGMVISAEKSKIMTNSTNNIGADISARQTGS